MGDELLTILKVAGVCGLGFILVGLWSLLVATRKAGREFRSKGYLKPPSGTAWFRFLLWKQYEYFETPGTQFFFGTSHFCMVGFILVFAAVTVLIGSEVLLNGVNTFTLSGPDAPTIPDQ